VDGAEMADGPAIIFIGEAVAYGDWADAETLAAKEFKVA
jgi:uroporphyrin-III C-methyltransferase/precorrin-2 dehydrogenase/sirohydrochlorin ferrochelatase